MKWLNFNVRFWVIVFIAFPFAVSARNGYEKRVENYQTAWQKLIPTHYKLQFAGGMGLVSAGIGWDYGKNDQWETDVLLGYLPKYSTNHSKVTLTVKQNFIPWQKRVNEWLSIDPLTCGMYVNTIFDGEFWVSEPDKYPSDYYSFSTKMRFWAFAGQRFTMHIPEEKRFFAKSLTLFYEISSCDLYIVSAFTNSYLKPTDYLRLSFGLKIQLF
ncbi:hypothetical protein [Dysgonomonas sp. 216]|uniref:hypothetical protein n=1 Tax=Dysgonomonas sp. 216 TaxID=2302934 RepID=UPI001628BE3D|nr:hypothetical protein [Dysgonomonas sp. 216]